VGDHDAPVGGVRVLGCLDGLGEGADLVDLEKQGVAGLELDGLLDAEGVGDSQVVADVAVSLGGYMRTRGTESTYPTIWKSEVLKK
jgi:hypothetical protein